jgi:glycosyltransferase involved in cell wall biosynthesis
MTISIIIPSTGRPALLKQCLESLRDSLAESQLRIEVVLVIDHDEESAKMARGLDLGRLQLHLDYSPEYRGNVAAWNRGLELSDGEFIVFAADDLKWGEGWLNAALNKMWTLPLGSGLVGFNDGHWGEELSTHYIMTRTFIIDVLGGVIAWEWYKHSFNDLETNDRAKAAGRYAWAEDAHVTHLHWTFGTREKDETDARWLPDYEAAKITYLARKEAGFPNNYPPVIGPDRKNKIRIGWLADIPYTYKGGAEMAAAELAAAVPDWAQIVPCPPGQVADDCNVYVIHNCFQYKKNLIDTLEGHKVVKVLHDLWPNGDNQLRLWLLDNAERIIFTSKLQIERFAWKQFMGAPFSFCPPPVDAERFIEAGKRAGERNGAVWLNRLFGGKGIRQACEWAVENKVPLDIYGEGPAVKEITEGPFVNYKGPVEYSQVPELLAGYQTYVFLPDEIDSYSRGTVEAWLAGCELVINENVGALGYLNGGSETYVIDAAKYFWSLIHEVVYGS